MIKALIFDCDGVLVDTERDGHRVGFNRAFAEFGIDAEWDVDLYARLLLVAGGKERMTAYFDEYGWPEDKVADHGGRDELIKALHKRKTAIVSELVSSGELPLRPGISRIVDEAIAADVKLGVCTTSNPAFINAVLDLFGPERKEKFGFVHAGDCVANKKPDPEIYVMAKMSLDVGEGGPEAHECVVIEDSRNGLLAAKGAGLPTLITTSTYTVDEDFAEADRVVPELGDEPHVNIRLADLGELAAARAAA
jgi:HAD superfamily hydrolase (TIGR01509 family)